MIINAFKNKLFPFYSGNYYEESKEESSASEVEDKVPDISTLEEVTKLDEIYGPDLINKYLTESFFNKIM